MKMRYLYFFLKFTLPYSLRLIYKRIITVNEPKQSLGRTFFASNHPNSFMDPLIPASMNKPIVHFMTRGDIYKGIVKHLFYHAHMLPIYRQHDGPDYNQKNEEVFKWVAEEVQRGKNILVFAEGFSDDIFVRRLKPMKKGIVRMAFEALVSMNWKEQVFIQALGMNYTNTMAMRSELIMKYGDLICVNDFREAYETNPSRVIVELSQRVELNMRAQITHIENIEFCELHENIMRILRKGMNDECTDFNIPLEDRLMFSQSLAMWLNTQNDLNLSGIQSKMKSYFEELQVKQIHENDVEEFSRKRKLSNVKLWFNLVLMTPIALFSFIYSWISWFIIKPKIEEGFKRPVFWLSVKLVVSHFVNAFYAGLLLLAFYFFIYPSFVVGILFILSTAGPSFIVFYHWRKLWEMVKRRKKIKPQSLDVLVERRVQLIKSLENILPQEFIK